jgi:GT2 family glycosyltransferase
MTDVSIILVNWNCLAFTEQCIASIYSTVSGVSFEVIVVDNASGDSPCQSLVERFPDVKLILSEQNLGFGRANNLGASHALGRNLFFLNPDTILLGDALRCMVNALETTPRSGAVGCRLLNPDRTLQISSVQGFPTVINQLLALEKLQRRWPSLPIWGKRALYATAADPVHEVDVVSGAGLLVRHDVFEQTGGFRPEYFMYAEEVELCYAVRSAGWKVLHCSSAEVIHFGGQSTNKREEGFADIAMRDSVHRFLRRTRGSAYGTLYRAALLLSATCRLTMLILCSPLIATLHRPISPQRATGIFRKWVRIGRWCFGPHHRSSAPTQQLSEQASAVRS